MGNLPAFLSAAGNLITVFKAFCYNTAADEQKEGRRLISGAVKMRESESEYDKSRQPEAVIYRREMNFVDITQKNIKNLCKIT